ncbi:hypothetical protein C1645_875924 [Glomus cerebriforme]|uniref:G-protein coupled receptors family 1 profile domain-containing protein n=1 Tax=Glomus cerebriforme TaxID=658196 RepID=A0A397SXD6_9GLOM|nr:hypothetical protein C1645_875924 [Glomus cerebriforme]
MSDVAQQKYFWHISGIIWIISILVNIYELNNNSKEKNWGVQSDTLFCKSIPTKTEWLSYLIPTTLYAVTSLIVTVHSSYTLWGRWRNFNQKQNRRTAIDLGYAVRLTVLSGVYSIILLFSLIPAVIKKVNHETGTLFTDFAPSIFGTILFMIFGTTKSAAIFLPCCYYAPPNDRKKQKSITSQQYSIDIDHPMRHESIELDAISKQEESLGIETTFDTFSSKNTILD